MTHATREVFNQPLPLADVNLFDINQPLQDAVKFNAPKLDTGALRQLGGVAG